jgi:peptidyl-prolyl cis-trans isomerase B (cyclophilin B)
VRKALLFLLLALAVAVAGCGGSSSDSASGGDATTDATTTNTATGADGCSDVDAPPARDDGGQTAPKERLDPEKTYDLVFETSCGSFTVRLDLVKAPATAASLVSLAKSGFYDNTIFHRVVPGFVVQGGDPTQSGSGGPGYQTVDPPPADSIYVEGVVAMAKTGAEPAGTSGSQFFVVSGPDAVNLPPDYAIVGTVTSGMDTVKRIDALGNANDPTGTPTRPIVIESVTVEEA